MPDDRAATGNLSCKQPAGIVSPVVNFGKCEGAAECVQVCPENVFAIGKIQDEDYGHLSLLEKFKQRVHGMKVAYTPKADACRACSLCVQACPEHAITLKRR